MDPALQLVRVTLEVLEATRVFQFLALVARLDLELIVPVEHLLTALLNIFGAFVDLYLLGGKLLQG